MLGGTAAAAAAALLLAAAPASAGSLTGTLGVPAPDPTIPAARDAEPVVLKGAQLQGLAAPANVTAKLPLTDLDPANAGAHNHYAQPEVDTGATLGSGPPIDRILGYRWNPHAQRFVQIPFQVDEVFTRYLDNTASGFAIYSGEDQHTTYAYDGPGDREGFRYRADGPPDDPCRAQPDSPPAHDPVPGLDANDEVSFMASDAGPQAPAGAALPKGIVAVRRVTVSDPLQPGATAYAYVMEAGPKGPRPAYNASNGYVRYQRDPDADLYAFSQSSYSDYGNAPQGIYCDADGNVVRNADGTPKIGRRRPRDGAWVTTPRYQFRYDGRWLMSQIRISPDNGATYGPDLVDRWKARAFAQDPASKTPCCGYEEEENNWGGSSTLLGERVGPVRAIRETWGADSGTNVIRRETFYRDEMVQRTWLRVHPIPPLDGIYAQWDFNAGVVDRYYNPQHLQGVPIDGRDDDVFNLDDPCNPRWDSTPTAAFDQHYRSLYRELQLCGLPYHGSVDPGDPTFSGVNAALGWSVTTGDNGTIVDRISVDPTQLTPGGAAQSVLAVPYYRDDSCFDDGTGGDPGPHLAPRSPNEPSISTATGQPRRCWTPADGIPDGSDRFYQGSIGTHGVHLLAIAETDNARLTVPVDQIVDDWSMVMLPGRRDATAGEQYGRSFEKPLVVTVAPGA